VSLITALCLALILDAIFGEPRWLWDRVPHPAILTGRFIGWLDQRLNLGEQKREKGIITLIILTFSAITLGWVLSAAGTAVTIVVAAIFLSHRSLINHVSDVASALRLSTGDGRMVVAKIVGRDTRDMDDPAIARAAIESAAENFSDGVIAPAFWFALFGLPGLMLYKFINTADSMIGYRNEKYEDFGWASARFDDLLNLIPARLSALMIAVLHGHGRDMSKIASDASLHRSPNAGWPEAAMARVLDVALSGPRSYDGAMRDFPYVNDAGRREIGPDEIDAACRVLWRTWGGGLALLILIAVVLG